MAHREFGKLVSTQMLESIKEVLEYLRRWAMRLDQEGKIRPTELNNWYGSVRRLHTYFSRAVSAHTEPVVVDLDPDDENLIVSCCVHSMEMLMDRFDRGDHVSTKEQEWMEGKYHGYTVLINELASARVRIVPGHAGGGTLKPDVARVVTAVNARIAGQLESLAARVTNQDVAVGETAIMHGAWSGSWGGKRNPLPSGESLPCVDELVTLEESKTSDPQPDLPQSGEEYESPSLPTAVDPGPCPSSRSLKLDTQMLRDPRLRTMLVLDLRALDRAMAAKDYRLAAAHMCSVLEGILVDCALPRRKELELTGVPETWQLEDVAKRLLGDSFLATDRGILYHTLACQHLLRPAVQLHNPVVVTAKSMEKMLAYLQKILVELGVSGSGGAEP